LNSGRWQEFLPKVYRVLGSPDSWEQDAMGACLWGGDEAALCCGAAARKWGGHGFENAQVEIATSLPKRNVGLPFKVRRYDRHLEREIVHIGTTAVTSKRRTVLDLAGRKHWRAERLLDQFLREDDGFLPDIWLLYEAEWTRGRRGIAIVRSWLDLRTPGKAPTESELEDMLWRLMVNDGMDLPVRQYRMALPSGNVRWDFAYPHICLAIECDSYRHHSDRQALDRDREKDAEAGLVGWSVLRFTWAQINYRPEWVLQTIRKRMALLSSGESAAY
jgi:very-short-patch-repair endonuclease